MREPFEGEFPMSIGLALLVSADPATRQKFSLALREFSISLIVCPEIQASTRLLNHRKFETVIVDRRLGELSGQTLDDVHRSLSNRTAVTFGIGDNRVGETAAFREESQFVFEGPLSARSIRNTLKPAYGLILRERRRYFRCPLTIPVTIARQTMTQVCHSVNVSEGGMALSTFVPFSLGEPVEFQFILPGCKVPFAVKSTICWVKMGQLGCRFTSLSDEHKWALRDWLARKLEEGLPDFVAQQSILN
jgi:hypothetical protein